MLAFSSFIYSGWWAWSHWISIVTAVWPSGVVVIWTHSQFLDDTWVHLAFLFHFLKCFADLLFLHTSFLLHFSSLYKNLVFLISEWFCFKVVLKYLGFNLLLMVFIFAHNSFDCFLAFNTLEIVWLFNKYLLYLFLFHGHLDLDFLFSSPLFKLLFPLTFINLHFNLNILSVFSTGSFVLSILNVLIFLYFFKLLESLVSNILLMKHLLSLFLHHLFILHLDLFNLFCLYPWLLLLLLLYHLSPMLKLKSLLLSKGFLSSILLLGHVKQPFFPWFCFIDLFLFFFSFYLICLVFYYFLLFKILCAFTIASIHFLSSELIFSFILLLFIVVFSFLILHFLFNDFFVLLCLNLTLFIFF